MGKGTNERKGKIISFLQEGKQAIHEKLSGSGLFSADGIVKRATGSTLKPNFDAIEDDKEEEHRPNFLFVDEAELEIQENLSGDLNQLDHSNVLAKARARTLTERHSVAIKLIGLSWVHPSFRLELKGILAPEFLVRVNAPRRHTDSSVFRKELATDSTATSWDSARKRKTSGRVEAECFLNNCSEKRNLRKVFPGGIGVVEGKKRLHEFLVDSRRSAKVDDDSTKSDRRSIRCSQARIRLAHGYARILDGSKIGRKVYSHKDIGMVGDFTQRERMPILIPSIKKTLKEIVAACKVSMIDTFLDFTLDTPSVMLHPILLDDIHLGDGPNPREIRPKNVSIE